MSTDNDQHYFGRAPLPLPKPNPKERGDKSATAKTKVDCSYVRHPHESGS
jgi:hypothetical protein